MSPKITSLKKAGLSALGLFGVSALFAADPGHGDVAPQAVAAAPAATPRSAVLLMSDGRLLEGNLVETDSGYQLEWKGNSIPIPKSKVEHVFGSIAEVYQSMAEAVPEHDPDEQFKLARWCLQYHLQAHAKTHLNAVLALSPGNPQAKAMLDNIKADEQKVALRQKATIDRSIIRTDAEEVVPSAMAQSQLRGRGAAGHARIFDLPTPLAVKRAREFDRFVSPVLQKYCAQCHNEQYPGEFQLIQIRGRQDQTVEVYRVNLDATLRLVDPMDLSKSVLLSSALRPHGLGPQRRPIFLGSNDPAYQQLASWVAALRSPDAVASGQRSALSEEPSAPGEGFAVNRGKPQTQVAASTDPRPRRIPAATPRSPELNFPPSRVVDGQMVFEETPPSEEEFPRSPLAGGPRPAPKLVPGRRTPTEPDAAPPAPNHGPLPPLPQDVAASAPTTTAPATPSAPSPPSTPGASATAGDKPAPAPADSDAAKKPRKRAKIDPALLEKALKARYGTP
jgi:hypothetical protein